jgi:nucleotide-binding universal stress UspA family protein
VILEAAISTQADLIMLGSHGPDPINGFSLGSVTTKVLQMAKVPVYMIPMLPSATRSNLNPFSQVSL